MAAVPQESYKAIPNASQLLLIFSPLEQMSDVMSDVMFLELWGKMSKQF